MKKVITEGVLEDAKYFCDRHPERECFSELKTASWYGSEFDMTGMEIHLCDDCLREMMDMLVKQFGIKRKNIEI